MIPLTSASPSDEFYPIEGMTFSGLACDSRQVKPGNLFVAITCDDVVSHIAAAVKSGATAVVIEAEILAQNHLRLPHVVYNPVKNTRQSLSVLARQFYPQQPDVIAAVTGTNGKSSVVTFVRQLWGFLGFQGASFGTLGLETTQNDIEILSLPKLTTPDAISLHQMLSKLKQADINHFVFEASSHGLDQYRLHGAGVMVAGFTNLTQDHLDYHLTMEAYFEAKSKLFTEILLKEGVAVINNDSDYANALKLLVQARGIQVLTYGFTSAADLRATAIKLHNSSIEFDLVTKNQTWHKVRVPVVSAFQIENILCAIGMVMAQNVPLEKIVSVLPQLTSAVGRMQLAGTTRGGAAIYVDYAHTPDALIRALQALKAHLRDSGKLQVVFGCGGNRDTGKRAAMGAAAEAFADVIYVTDDNPRLEDASFIRAQVLAGCPKGVEVPDRYVAIEKAINGLQSKDILLIAGKGHETGQTILGEVIPFCDVQVVQEILARRNYGFMDRG